MAVNLIQGKQIATASWSQNAVTASYAPAYLPLTGGTIDGNVTVNGTASIAFLSVAIESASVIYSSGSNVFGDATNDTQRLNGTVIVSGSQQITGSLTVVNTAPRIILRNSGSGASGQIGFTAIDNTFYNKSVGTNVYSLSILDGGETTKGGIVYTKASNKSTNTSFNYNDFANTAIYISGSGNVGIRTTTPNSASLHVSGNVWASSFTGSLLGTASFADSSLRAVTSSFVTGSNVFGPFGSNSISSASFAVSASWAPSQAIDTSSFATTGSNIFIGNQVVTGSVTATQGFRTNWGVDNSKIALFGVDYPAGVNTRQILFNDISNNDFNYQSQSINILANVEEGFGVGLGGDPNGTPVSSNISTGLGSSKIENTSGTDFGKIETSPGIVAIRTNNGGYEQLIQLKSDSIQNVISNNGTSEENALTIQTNRTYTTKYIETDEGFIGSYLQATSITGSLLGTASFAVSASWAPGGSSTFPYTGNAVISGSLQVTGSLRVSGSITGSLFGTASYATQAASATSAPLYLPLAGGFLSGDLTATNRTFQINQLTVGNGSTAGNIKTDAAKPIGLWPGATVESARFLANGNTVLGTSFANTGSFRLQVSASTGGAIQAIGNSVITGSLNVTQGITGSLFGTASWAQHALTSSYSLNPTISGSINNVNFIDFNESAGITVESGQLAWNSSDGTLDLGLKGGNVTLQIGQETLYEVRNDTGVTISKGTSLYASGVTAGSSRIEASPFRADGSIREVRFLGLATENISNGVNGFVTHFGYIKGLDTRGIVATAISVGDENWSEGDILYAHQTVPGKLTNVKPKHEISVAIVIDRHENTGVLFVRPSSFGHLEDNHDVNINTGSLATGDLLIYDSGSDYWINSKQLSGSYGLTGSLEITGSISLFKDTLSTGSIAYTLQQQDTGRILQFTSSAAVEITIPPNLQVGSRFEGKQLGTGQLSFVTGSGVTLRTAATENAKTAEQYSVFAIDWIGVEEYMLYGRLEQA